MSATAKLILLRKPTPPVAAVSRGCVATIGTFDGLHIGHRRILDRVQTVAREMNLPSVVFSFEPTPKEYFSRASSPARLMRFREKYVALQEAGTDIFFCPRFGAAMAGQEPDEFVEHFLLEILNVKHLVVGDDFQFARRRSGTINDLRRNGELHGFTVEQMGSVIEGGQRVSSSMIRDLLEAGDLDHAKRLLGGRYRMAGKVVLGQQLGRELGMPTANVRLDRNHSAVQGIFAVRVAGVEEGQWLDGVASVGTRPTVDGVESLLEVHIFNFDRDIYGAHIQVEFVARLRDELRFPDIDSLKEQMFRDAENARHILKDNND